MNIKRGWDHNIPHGPCPPPQAVCCSDREHCCPKGYVCNVAEQTCDRPGAASLPWLSKIPPLQEVPAQAEKPISHPARPDRAACDGESSCPRDTTCCYMEQSRRWGCCPLPDVSHPPTQPGPRRASCSGLCNQLWYFSAHVGGLLQRRTPLLPRVSHLRPCTALLFQGLRGHPLVHQGGGHHRAAQCHRREMWRQDQLRFRNHLLPTGDGPVAVLPPWQGLGIVTARVPHFTTFHLFQGLWKENYLCAFTWMESILIKTFLTFIFFTWCSVLLRKSLAWKLLTFSKFGIVPIPI